VALKWHRRSRRCSRSVTLASHVDSSRSNRQLDLLLNSGTSLAEPLRRWRVGCPIQAALILRRAVTRIVRAPTAGAPGLLPSAHILVGVEAYNNAIRAAEFEHATEGTQLLPTAHCRNPRSSYSVRTLGDSLIPRGTPRR
jgi:hypothetical protein